MAAARPMTKSQIVDHLAKKTDTTKKLAVQFLEELVSLAHKEAKKSFLLPGLGKLVLVQRKKSKDRKRRSCKRVELPVEMPCGGFRRPGST